MTLPATLPSSRRLRATLAAAALVAGVAATVGQASQPSTPFDLVLSGGRVMDPASGLDAVRHVGIRGARIAAISTTPLPGGTTVDVSGLVVAPGFIDPHAHAQTLEGNQFQALDLMTALRKISLMVAERLEPFVPAMRSKGRIAVGADADVTVFDAATVIDRATYENPAQFSEGIRHVIVGGTFVVRDEQLIPGVTPGRAVRVAR